LCVTQRDLRCIGARTWSVAGQSCSTRLNELTAALRRCPVSGRRQPPVSPETSSSRTQFFWSASTDGRGALSSWTRYQGHEAEENAYIEEGCLEISISGQAVVEAGAGELIGEASGFVGASERTVSLRAIGPCILRVCSHDHIKSLRRSLLEVYYALLDRALEEWACRVHRSGVQRARLGEGIEPRPERVEAGFGTAPAEGVPYGDLQLQNQAAHTRNTRSERALLPLVLGVHLDSLEQRFATRVTEVGPPVADRFAACFVRKVG